MALLLDSTVQLVPAFDSRLVAAAIGVVLEARVVLVVQPQVVRREWAPVTLPSADRRQR